MIIFYDSRDPLRVPKTPLKKPCSTSNIADRFDYDTFAEINHWSISVKVS